MNMSVMLSSKTESSVKKALFEKFANQEYYNQPFLNPNDPRCNPDDYLDACTEKVPLEDIYKFISTCYQNDSMFFYPVLFEIVAPRIQKRFKDCKYLIQVWNAKKKKVFELELAELFKYWNICDEYLIIMRDDKDEEGNLKGTFTLRIYDFRRSNKWFEVINIKVDDQVNHVVFHEDILYMASETKLYVGQIEHMIDDEKQVPPDVLKLKTIDPGMRIHGFVSFNLAKIDNQMIVLMENDEHLIDINRLKVQNLLEDEFTYHFYQHREIKPTNKYLDDPIVKHEYSVTDYHYGVSLRQSGKIELYWNMNITEVLDDVYVEDVIMSLKSFYFKLYDGRYLRLDHCNSESYKFSSAVEILPSQFNKANIQKERVQNVVKIFSGFNFSTINGNNGAVIANNDFVSLYDLSTRTWFNHIEWETEVFSLFRIIQTKGYGGTPSIITKNGGIYLGVIDYKNFEGFVPTKWRDHKIDGEIIRTSEDCENQFTVFITYKEDDKYKMKYLFRKRLLDFDCIPASDNDNLQCVTIQVRTSDTYYVIIDGKTLYIYRLKISEDDEPSFEKVRELENIEIKGILHSACAFEVDEFITMFDQTNLYYLDFSLDKPFKTQEDVYAVSVQNFTQHCNYVICEDMPTKNVKGGMKCYSITQLKQKQKLTMMHVANVNVGALSNFDFGFSTRRLGLIESMTSLNIMPILHWSCMKFIGFKDKDEYICYKQIGDKFMALELSGRLLTWSIPTGTLIGTHQIENGNFDKYEIKSKYQIGPVLLKSKDDYPDIDQQHFFEPIQLAKSTTNQTPFILHLEKSIKRWKYIEIKSETEITTHCEFYNPSYEKEWIFVSEDKTKMIVTGLNYRTFIYQAVPDTVLRKREGDENVIKWQLIKKFDDYPANFSDNYNTQEFFTPNFSRYIIYDQGPNKFFIKDTYTDVILFEIPQELMKVNPGREVKHVINRIKLLSENLMLVVSEDGVEKLIDIDDGFKQISYNYRPLFNSILGEEHLKHPYYFLREQIEVHKSYEKLQARYQAYKSAFYLFEKRDITQLNEELLSFDKYTFACELSFTLLDWSLIEQIRKGQLDVDDIHEDEIKRFLFNILPGGNTILHRLCDREEQLIKIMKIAHPDEKTIKYHTPFLPNVLGETPLHRCIQKSDFKSIDIILKYLKNYHIDHHTRGIEDLYPVFIKQNLPGFLEYVDNRILQTNQCKTITRGCLKEDYPEMLTTNLWFNEQELISQIMKEKPIENRIICSFIDLAGIYHQQHDKFLDFFGELAETDEPEYFNKKVIQKVIEFNYPLVREYLVKKLFIPFCVFLVVFQYFLFEINEHQDNEFYQHLFYPFLILNILFATYFLSNEIIQFTLNGFEYFADVWNYIDIIPPVGIYAVSVLILLEKNEVEINVHLEKTITAIITFFMWFKLLYFLRIFRSTGYLIGMILEVIKDMRFFFFVLLVTIIAFGSSFLTIALGNDAGPNRFTTDNVDAIVFTYRMILGDFDTGAFGEVATPMVWVLFLLCTVFNMIVMLNLLIAIISETFARVTGLADQKIYQEMAALIAENSYLIPEHRKNDYALQNQYLMLIEDLENVEKNEQNDLVLPELKAINEKLDKLEELLKKK